MVQDGDGRTVPIRANEVYEYTSLIVRFKQDLLVVVGSADIKWEGIAIHTLDSRFKGHHIVMSLFSFLIPKRLSISSNDDIWIAVKHIIKEYEYDFSKEDLEFEIRSFVTEFKSEIEGKDNVKKI